MKRTRQPSALAHIIATHDLVAVTGGGGKPTPVPDPPPIGPKPQ